MNGRILIVDGVATHRIVLKVKLAAACYEVLQARSGAEALRMAGDAAPDLVILGVATGGPELCAKMKSLPATAGAPVIMIADRMNPALRQRALEAGAEDVLQQPLDEWSLLARVRNLLRFRQDDAEYAQDALGFAEPVEEFARPGRIALVGTANAQLLQWKTRLAGCMPHSVELVDRDTALAGADDRGSRDLFVIAADGAEPQAPLRLLSELRSRAQTRGAGVLLALWNELPEIKSMALDLGAVDLLDEAMAPAEIALRLARQVNRKRRRDRVRDSVSDHMRLAMRDPLTGLFNRRYALPYLARLGSQATAAADEFAIMLLDLDRFKLVNDRFGHPAGDTVLKEVSDRLHREIAQDGLVARIGGEEFLVALPGTGRAAAERVAGRLRRLIEERPVRLSAEAGELGVTVSIGVATGGGSDQPTTLLERADRALYEAKAEGRNQVNLSPMAA